MTEAEARALQGALRDRYTPKPSRMARKAKEREDRVKELKAESDNKKAVRQRDQRRCRFPLCGCLRLGFRLHVSHQEHKGMGGNPKGDRSTTDKMILVCAPRHRESAWSIDRGTVKWEGLTERGADGPVRWLVLLEGDWLEVAREHQIGRLVDLEFWQEQTLKNLAKLDV